MAPHHFSHIHQYTFEHPSNFWGNKAKKGAENFDFCQIYDIFAPLT